MHTVITLLTLFLLLIMFIRNKFIHLEVSMNSVHRGVFHRLKKVYEDQRGYRTRTAIVLIASWWWPPFRFRCNHHRAF